MSFYQPNSLLKMLAIRKLMALNKFSKLRSIKRATHNSERGLGVSAVINQRVAD